MIYTSDFGDRRHLPGNPRRPAKRGILFLGSRAWRVALALFTAYWITGGQLYANDWRLSLTVTGATLCTNVDDGDRSPVGRLATDDTVVRGPVYLWTVLSGNLETLRNLRERKLLPIRHRWFYAPALKFQEVDDNQLTDPEPVRIGRIEHFAKLRDEVLDKNVFDWRTWSGKSNLLPGIYVVAVTYQDGSPVLRNDTGKPCVVRFKY